MAGRSELVVSFGEMLIDFVPTVAGVSLAEAPAFVKAPGGAPANVAIAVARLGGGAAFVGKLGDDEFGRMLAAILRDNGVDDGGVVFDAGARTALAFVTLRADGEREFMFYRNPSADMLLTHAELNVELIKRAAVFHYGSISLIAEPCRSAHLRAMEIAKEAGALLSYDPNLREALWPSREEARTKILSIWDQADIVKVSEVELEFLTGIDSVEDDVVMKLWRPTMKLLLVTLGDQGCKYYARDFRGAVPSYKVQQVDTTGAGDAFVGALLRRIVQDPSSLQDQKKLEEAIKFANACGAITATKKGAIPSLPTEVELRYEIHWYRISDISEILVHGLYWMAVRLSVYASQQSRASWNPGLEKALVDLLHEHNNPHYRCQNGWTSEAWNKVVKEFRDRHPYVTMNKQQIQDKEKELKRDYRLLKEARKQSGASWDNQRCMIVADDAVWANIITV
uniref:fructokinase n=1 Tax=Oryza rufipogon TaxID=4529 RepID=A0A0E0N662_ORYRU